MGTPDKIYINGFSAFATVPVKEGIEYIRKDALLEWLEKKVPLSYGLATDAFIEIIDKLNSM